MASIIAALSATLRFVLWLAWRISWGLLCAFVGICAFWAADTEEAGRPIPGSGTVVKCESGIDPAAAQCMRDDSVPPGTAKPGDRTLTSYQFQIKRTDCSFFFVRETKDAMGWIWPTTAYVIVTPKGTGTGPVNFTMVIPMDAAAGAADFTNRWGSWCNPLQWAMRGLRESDMPPVTITIVRG